MTLLGVIIGAPIGILAATHLSKSGRTARRRLAWLIASLFGARENRVE